MLLVFVICSTLKICFFLSSLFIKVPYSSSHKKLILFCLSMGEWINWYVNAMGQYSAIKKNELLSHKATWKTLKGMMLSERNLSKGYILVHSQND